MADGDGSKPVTNEVLLEKIENLTTYIKEMRTDLCDKIKDHEGRLREVEKRGWTKQDVGAYITALGAGVASFLAGNK